MVTIIIYDIKAGQNYNKVKRNFYYHLGKINVSFLNKSVILIKNKEEHKQVMDLFSRFREHIIGYVLEVDSIKPL